MMNETLVQKLYEELDTFHKRRTGKLFPDSNNNCWHYERKTKKVHKVLNDESPIGISFDILKELSEWHLDYTFYQLLEKNSLHAAQEEFNKSAAYGYLYAKKANEAWGCHKNYEFTLMSSVSRMMAQNIIAQSWIEAYEIAEVMIESINFGIIDDNGYPRYKLIECGLSVAPATWFILELYCITNNREFDRKKADYPKNMKPYDDILKQWNITDMGEMDRLIYLLSDQHLEQTKEQVNDDDYFEFGDTFSWLFPYEILVWLKLRERQGLKNPTEFSHPLMNTPIAKMFLDIKEPLEKPKELPYAKELLEKVQEKCPKITLPDWL